MLPRFIPLLFLLSASSLSALEGQLSLELRQFGQPNQPEQVNADATLAGELRYLREWNDGDDQLVIIPAFRANSEDSEQNRVDLKSFSWNHRSPGRDWRIGVRTVTWQVVESNHLMDIINQSDASSDVDGEDKLGEFMLNLVQLTDWGFVELLIMPGFRERVLPGERARLRAPVPFDNDSADYESAAEELRTDAAVRLNWLAGDVELSLSHFSGTSREPKFNVVFDGPLPSLPPGAGLPLPIIPPGSGNFTLPNVLLQPEYRVIDQTGLGLQYAAGDWLWKLEAISNSGFEDERYAAAVAGFEFTWSGLGETGYDLGVLMEALWDERDAAPLQQDLFVGVRLGLNDIAGTSLLAGAIVDTDSGEYLATAEFSRRLGSHWRLDIEARVFGGAEPAEADFDFLHKDDYVTLSLTRYF